jgi:hypothetical protein
VDVEFTEATGFAERETGIRLMKRNKRRSGCTLAADKAYDTRHFVAECRALGVTPHVAQNIKRDGGSASMHAPRGTPVIWSASVSANASRRPSAGARTGAREDHADRAIATLFRERGDQNIPRKMVFVCIRRHANAATGHCRHATCGYQVDMLLLRHYTVVRAHNWKNRSLGECFFR